MQVRWTEQAVADLRSVREFIERDSPLYGRLVAERLFKATDRLEAFPRSGRVVPEVGRDDLRASLRSPAVCITLSYMKTAAVTIRLEAELEELLDKVCRETGRSRSDVVRDALRRQLTLQLFDEARRNVVPFAERQGILTDEDVFKLVS